MNASADSPLGLLTFLSFGFSIIAAVLAIDMYKLLRSGGFGRTWRMLIIASVIFVLLQVLRMAEVLNFQPNVEERLAQIVELCFVMTLAFAFYNQRNVFTQARRRTAVDIEEDPEVSESDRWELDVIDDDELLEYEEGPVTAGATSASSDTVRPPH
jgi:hypothetical protein